MDLIDSFSGKSLKWHIASKDVLLAPLIMRCISRGRKGLPEGRSVRRRCLEGHQDPAPGGAVVPVMEKGNVKARA